MSHCERSEAVLYFLTHGFHECFVDRLLAMPRLRTFYEAIKIENEKNPGGKLETAGMAGNEARLGKNPNAPPGFGILLSWDRRTLDP